MDSGGFLPCWGALADRKFRGVGMPPDAEASTLLSWNARAQRIEVDTATPKRSASSADLVDGMPRGSPSVRQSLLREAGERRRRILGAGPDTYIL